MNICKSLSDIVTSECVFVNEPMKNHTSFKIGGPAECLIKISNIEDLKAVLNVVEKNNGIPVLSVFWDSSHRYESISYLVCLKIRPF